MHPVAATQLLGHATAGTCRRRQPSFPSLASVITSSPLLLLLYCSAATVQQRRQGCGTHFVTRHGFYWHVPDTILTHKAFWVLLLLHSKRTLELTDTGGGRKKHVFFRRQRMTICTGKWMQERKRARTFILRLQLQTRSRLWKAAAAAARMQPRELQGNSILTRGLGFPLSPRLQPRVATGVFSVQVPVRSRLFICVPFATA